MLSKYLFIIIFLSVLSIHFIVLNVNFIKSDDFQPKKENMTFNIEYKTIIQQDTTVVQNAIITAGFNPPLVTTDDSQDTNATKKGRHVSLPLRNTTVVQNDTSKAGLNPPKITTNVSRETTNAKKGRHVSLPLRNTNDIQNNTSKAGFNPPLVTTDDSQETTATERGRHTGLPLRNTNDIQNNTTDIQNATVKAGFNPPFDTTDDSQLAIDASEKENIKNSYISKLKQEIENKKYYPKQARRLKYEGVVEVYFIILKNGKITNIKIVNTSNYEIIDEAALDIIKKVNKFEPLPDIFKVEALPVKIPIKYELL